MNRDAPIYVAGSETFVGKALVRRMQAAGFTALLTDPVTAELTNGQYIADFFDANRPAYVFVAAGLTGGIHANQARPVELMTDNLLSATHLITHARRARVRKLIYLASSCCYPRECPQPMKETDLFAGPVEPTNEAYATAKRAAIALCEACHREYSAHFIPVIPANPYGPGDDFSEANSHVAAALIRRLNKAKDTGASETTIWGTGKPRRDFIYVDDLADACVFLMENDIQPAPINIGTGTSVSIAELARLVKSTVGYRGQLIFDPSKPDGMPEKVLDSSRLFALGWRPSITLEEGLKRTNAWYRETMNHAANQRTGAVA